MCWPSSRSGRCASVITVCRRVGGWRGRRCCLRWWPVRRVKVGVELSGRFSSVDEALIAGRISWEHARVIVTAANPRIVEKIADIQDHLVAAARGTLFERWRREVTGIADSVGRGRRPRPRRRPVAESACCCRAPSAARPRCRAGWWASGAWSPARPSTTWPPSCAAPFKADREVCPELVMPDQSTLRALAFVELCRRGLGVDLDADQGASSGCDVGRERRDPAVGGGHPRRHRRPRRREPGVVVRSRSAPHRLGQPGHPRRYGPHRALRHRPPTTSHRPARRRLRLSRLRMPGGVDRRPSRRALHTDRGPTDIDNLAGLCRHHHRVTHRNGWTMTATADGWFWWTTPTGDQIWSQRHGTQRNSTMRAGPAPPRECTQTRCRSYALALSPNTSRTDCSKSASSGDRAVARS